MDRSYPTAPRPQYPAGFRPVPAPVNGYAFRRFGSLSNVASRTDSPSMDWASSSIRGQSPFSPVASPIGFSPSHRTTAPRPLFSPTYDNVPSHEPSTRGHQPTSIRHVPIRREPTPDTFLEKLRLQKQEIQQWQPPQPVYAVEQRTELRNGQQEEPPRQLHKTRSDMGPLLIRMNGGGTTLLERAVANGERNALSWRNPVASHRAGSQEKVIPVQVQLDRDRVLTIPPQPVTPLEVDVGNRRQPYNHQVHRSYTLDPSEFANRRYTVSEDTPGYEHNDGYAVRQAELKNMLERAASPILSNGYNGGYSKANQQREFQSSTLPRNMNEYRPHQPSSKFAIVGHSISKPMTSQDPLPSRPYSPARDYSPIRQTAAVNSPTPTFHAPPPPPPPPPPPTKIKQQQEPRRTPVQKEIPRNSPIPGRPGNVPQEFHEELLSMIPQGVRPSALRSQSPFRTQSPFRSRSPAVELCRPVGSKVKETGVRVNNGFGAHKWEDPMSASFPAYGQDAREVLGGPQRAAVVSRPESPSARLINGLEERWKQLKEENARQNEERKRDDRSSGVDWEEEVKHLEQLEKWQKEKDEQQRRDEEVARWRRSSGEWNGTSARRPDEAVEQQRKEDEEVARWRRKSGEWNGTRRNDDEMKWKRRNSVDWHSGYRSEDERSARMEPRGILRLRSESPTKRPSGRRVAFQEEDDVVFLSQEGSSRGSPAPAASTEAPPHVRAFDDATEASLEKWSKLGKAIGGDAEKATEDARSIFAGLRTFLWQAAGRAEPTPAEFQTLLQPLSGQIGALGTWRESRRNTPLFNHVSAVAEGIPAVGWVTVKPTPAPYIKEMIDSSMFYVNRVLKDNKEHSEWVNTWKELLNALHTFVRQTHTTGLVWNSAPGATAPSGAAKSAGGPPPPLGGPPPPPPPPPVEFLASGQSGSSAADKDKAGRDALFSELNKGEGVTSRLKKVTADMQTHKNPSIRADSKVPGTVGAKAAATSPAKTAAPAVVKPPRTALEQGKQWTVEYHKGNENIVIEITDKKQTLYVYKCENCLIQVKGKLNSITLDSCKKTSIVFDALVAQCETINCQSIKIQTLGEMPTISIQKTDGCQVYLSEAARNAEIVTSKSSEMNIVVPKGGEGDFDEFPVPEQFKTVYQNGKLVTMVSDIM